MKEQCKFFCLLSVSILSLLTSFAQDITRSQYNGESEIKASNSITLTSGFHVPAGSNFKAFIGFNSDCALVASDFDQNVNYFLTYTTKVPGIKDASDLASKTVCEVGQTIEYSDGLSRPLQTIQLFESPGLQDIIQPYQYDRFGRQPKKYLPYTAAHNNGAYAADALARQSMFYSNTSGDYKFTANPYDECQFEESPLSRVVAKGAPGGPWHVGEHPKRVEYSTNNNILFTPTSFSGCKRVALYKANLDASGKRILYRENWNAVYPNSRLFVTIYKDEDSNGSCLGSIEEYKDTGGKLLLKRTYNHLSNNNVQMLSTYYVYDQFDNLCFILPPNTEPDNDAEITGEVIDNLCFQYRYDDENRLVEKKVPGKGWEFLIYNKLGQVIMSQDANQRNKAQQEWAFVKYDALGRTVMTGIYKDEASVADGNVLTPSSTRRLALQSFGDNQVTLYEKRDNNGSHGYSNVAFPTSDIKDYLLVNYFDNYNIPGMPSLYNSSLYSKMTEGLVTASKVAVLNNPANMLWTVNYYDNTGNAVKSFIQHFKGGVVADGNYDEIANSYSFTGQILSSVRTHKVSNTEAVKIESSFDYDHSGRNINSYQRINNDPSVTLSHLEYNGIGQLKEKKLHSDDGVNFLQSVNLNYNERGWLKNSSSELFKEELLYEDPSEGYESFNGNISGVRFGKNLEKVFDYYYDKIGRLTKAELQGELMSEELTYDKAGNIKTLTRDGNLITYAYKSSANNQLASVSGGGLFNNTYEYDPNGNATVDGSKNNLNIEYNILDLPQIISGSKSIVYQYDASGKMWSMQSAATGLNEYIYGIQYGNTNGAYGIDFIKTSVGRAVRQADNTYKYQYDLTDHLGNVRVTFQKDPNTGLAEIVQQDDYYAFGKRKSVPLPSSGAVSQLNKYLYNGKDIQDELGQYDYGARFYDPETARWNVADPLSDQFTSQSPYNYVFNSPVSFTDPDGRAPNDWIVPQKGSGMPRKPIWQDNVTYSGDPDMPAGYEYIGRSGEYTHEDGRSVRLYDPATLSPGQRPWDWIVPTEGLNHVPYAQTTEAFQAAITANMPGLDIASAIAENTAAFVAGGVGGSAGSMGGTISGFGIRSGISSIGKWAGRIFTAGEGGLGFAAKGGTNLISQFSTSTIDDAVGYAMKNKVTHVFGKAAHNLDPLVTQLGGHENTFRAVLNAANGRLPSSGMFKDVMVNVLGHDVYLRGSVINGVPKIGTMFIK